MVFPPVSAGAPPCAFFPVKSSLNDRNALAAVDSFAIIALKELMTFAINFTACVATGSTSLPIFAIRPVQACFRFPIWFVQVSDSLAACPMAPDSLFASSTICNSVSCFWDSDNSMNDLP